MELVSARCKLHPLVEAHFSDLIQMYLDCPEGNRFIPGLRAKTPAEYREVLLSKMERNKEYIGFWTVYTKEKMQLVGTVNLYDFPGRNIIHIGLHLHINYWGTGLSKELMELLLDYGFNTMHYKAIHAVIDEQNLKSRKLFEQLGFQIKETFMEEDDKILIYQKEIPRF